MPGPMMPGPVVGPPSGSVEVPCPPVDPPSPLVKIRVRVAECSPAGQEIAYHITVENCSPAPAHHVIVRNPVPANCRFVRSSPEPTNKDGELAWDYGTMFPGDCRTIRLVLAPTDTADVKNCARVQFEHGQCVVTRIARGSPMVVEPPKDKEPAKESPKIVMPEASLLSVKITGPVQQYANLAGKYQITVVNTSDKYAENFLVTAFLPDGSIFVDASDNGKFHNKEVAWCCPNCRPAPPRPCR